MKHLYKALIFALFLLVFGCEFEPQGIYEADVQPVTIAPEISVDLNFDSDTVFIPSNRTVQLNYTVSDNLVRFAKFSLNSKQLATIESKSGTFGISFNPTSYSTNFPYELKVDIFRGSGSGSLADKLNSEGFLYSKSFVLYFLDPNQMSSQITKVGPENGSLKIEWEKFKGLGFKNYHVFNTVFRKVAIIPDQNQNWVYDDSFIGLNGEYYIVTEATDDSYQSEVVNYSYDLPAASVTHPGDMNLQINWGQNIFRKNIKGYRIYEWYRRFNIINVVATIENPDDTSLLYTDGRFAVNTKYFIQPIPTVGEAPELDSWGLWNLASPTNDITIGDNMPVIPFSFFCKSKSDFCYYSNNYHVLKFDCQNETFIDSIPTLGLCVAGSPNGNFLLAKNGDRMEIIDANQMQPVNTIATAELPEANEPYQWTLGNNNIGVFVNQLANFYFYDFENRKELAKFRIDGELNFGDVMKISSDATHFCIRHIKGIYPNYLTELFKLENGNAVTVLQDTEIDFFDFDSDQFIYSKNGKLTTVSLQDLSTISEFDLNNEFICDIDRKYREYLVLNDARDLFSIRDLDSGTVKKQLKTFEFGSGQSDYYSAWLSNKTLFTQGLRIKLNY